MLNLLWSWTLIAIHQCHILFVMKWSVRRKRKEIWVLNKDTKKKAYLLVPHTTESVWYGNEVTLLMCSKAQYALIFAIRVGPAVFHEWSTKMVDSWRSELRKESITDPGNHDCRRWLFKNAQALMTLKTFFFPAQCTEKCL